MKQALLTDVMASTEEGKPSEVEKAFIRHLAGTGWTWSEFDRWALEFKKVGQYPSMWRALGLDDEEAPVEPVSVADAIDGLTVAEMKDWLRTYVSHLKPMPKTREELAQECRTHLAWGQIREAAQVRYQDALGYFRERREEAKCRLLAHTFEMTGCSIRNQRDQKGFGVTQWEALPGGDCPIEQEWADKFNRGELKDQLPPFFPGDRCDLLPCLEEDVNGSD